MEQTKNINLRNNPELVDRRDGEVGLDGVKFPAEVFSFAYVKTGNLASRDCRSETCRIYAKARRSDIWLFRANRLIKFTVMLTRIKRSSAEISAFAQAFLII